MSKSKISSRLTYSWWVYVLSAAVFVVLWLWIFSAISQPAANEKIIISYVGSSLDEEALQSDLGEELHVLTAQNIESVTVETVISDNAYTLTNALWARSLDSDIIIIEHSSMFETIGSTFFLPLDSAAYTEVFGEVQFFKDADGELYGILLTDGSGGNVFSRYYTGEEQCWLFFTSQGVNTGGLNGSGNTSDDAALKVAQWLFSSV